MLFLCSSNYIVWPGLRFLFPISEHYIWCRKRDVLRRLSILAEPFGNQPKNPLRMKRGPGNCLNLQSFGGCFATASQRVGSDDPHQTWYCGYHATCGLQGEIYYHHIDIKPYLGNGSHQTKTRWWFQTFFFMFTPIWGNDLI